MKIDKYGTTPAGADMTAYTLEGANGAFLQVLDYGGKVVRLCVPDKSGACENVAMSLSFAKPGFGGSLIGRYANRISGGRFTIDGVAYATPTNIAPEGMPALLHGGAAGFHDRLWSARPFQGADGSDALELSYTSPDGEGGFPGTLSVTVVYTFTKTNVWRIEWTATTDKATPVNFTHHVYFNLSGERRAPIDDNRLTLAAPAITPTGAGQCTTGEIRPVAGTDFDFTSPAVIGSRMGGLYDHNFVLASQTGALAFAAKVEDPASGRVVETWTTEPGIQFYAGGALHDGLKDQFERPLFPFAGFALETQRHPDSVNHPNFPESVLRPGETFRSVTEYRFL